MAQNLKLNPVLRDYEVVNGSPIPSDRVEEAAYYALKIPEGKYLYGETGQGSYLYTLENQKRDRSIEQNFAALARDAIKRQLIDTGIATKQEISVLETTRTGSSNQIKIEPAQTNLSDELDFVSV